MHTDRITYWLFADRIPLTKLVIVSNVATFVGLYLFRAGVLLACGAFITTTAFDKPWTAVTYPLIGGYSGGVNGLISLLFACYWLWVAGGNLERSWGSGRFAVFFAEMSAITAVAIYAGTLVTGVPNALVGLWLPLAGVTVAFAMLNPETVVLLMFILPLKLKYLALISAAMVLVGFAQDGLIVGLFALAGCAFSYWYVRTGRQFGGATWPRTRGQVVRVHEREGIFQRLNPARWLRRTLARRRLRKLFKDSGLGEDDRR